MLFAVTHSGISLSLYNFLSPSMTYWVFAVSSSDDILNRYQGATNYGSARASIFYDEEIISVDGSPALCWQIKKELTAQNSPLVGRM
jgi:hypothetical protein